MASEPYLSWYWIIIEKVIIYIQYFSEKVEQVEKYLYLLQIPVKNLLKRSKTNKKQTFIGANI